MNIQDGDASKEEVHDAQVMWAKGENNMEDMQNYDQFGATQQESSHMNNLSQMSKKEVLCHRKREGDLIQTLYNRVKVCQLNGYTTNQ